jgi:hypothetical protein
MFLVFFSVSSVHANVNRQCVPNIVPTNKWKAMSHVAQLGSLQHFKGIYLYIYIPNVEIHISFVHACQHISVRRIYHQPCRPIMIFLVNVTVDTKVTSIFCQVIIQGFATCSVV